MRLKEAVERGTIVLQPLPTNMFQKEGDIESLMLGNPKTGAVIEILKFRLRPGMREELILMGDVPVPRSKLSEAERDMPKGCIIKERHQHGDEVDLHPLCYSESFVPSKIRKLWEWANKWNKKDKMDRLAFRTKDEEILASLDPTHSDFLKWHLQ